MVGYVSTLQKTLALGKRDKNAQKFHARDLPDWCCGTPDALPRIKRERLPAPFRGKVFKTCDAFAASEARAHSYLRRTAEPLGSLILPVAY
jgi:hypothetical protein